MFIHVIRYLVHQIDQESESKKIYMKFKKNKKIGCDVNISNTNLHTITDVDIHF